MAIDAEVEQAVKDAVGELGQDDKLAQRLVSWLQSLSRETPTQEDDRAHLESVLRACRLSEK